ncbi:hypothetical protein [Pelomonas sp. SE-A7]|uniref:hypothetical protein n=1 Tax=Pelomonas sp. SE-A7 TaxID=3054953 RepID=UPI00259CE013|nr:hypothetical protein [Pelomonas sp. SE-A7]MDM4766235.1 hypothetical protein [Pelomonas sp. SE-A7]
MSKLATFLSGCAASATAIMAITLLTGAKAPPAKFEEIDVGRINVREPDGTLRLVISNKAQFPGDFMQGKEGARPDRADKAGMLFINDEGTENGGFIQKGAVAADGKADAGLSLTFDRFRQDQVLQLLHAERGGDNYSALKINDQPSGTELDVHARTARMKEIEKLDPAARRAAISEMRAQGQLQTNRVTLGTTPGKSSALMLSDAQGRPRLMLMVTPEGKPSIQLLDDKGQPAKTIDLESK